MSESDPAVLGSADPAAARSVDSSGAAPRRVIAHLDMDAFYASVELLRYPELRGLPVVIGGGSASAPREIEDEHGRRVRSYRRLGEYVGRGVATTATYEARALGIHSAMGLMKAARKAPQAILLPTDFERYRDYSAKFKAAVRELAPCIENRGIDEIFIDLSAHCAHASEDDAWTVARRVALDIRDAVRAATGLSCSIGLAPNKLLAKIASDLEKPAGLTIVRETDVRTRIWPLPVRSIKGIGPKTGARLEASQIATVGDLAGVDPQWLVERFGRSYGAWMHEAAHGRDTRGIVTSSEPKSISRETTFSRDLHAVADRDELGAIFTELCADLADDLRRHGYAGRTVGIKLRFDNFSTVTRDHTIAAATADARAIRRAAGECLKRVPLERRIRLLGVRIAKLERIASAEPRA